MTLDDFGLETNDEQIADDALWLLAYQAIEWWG